MNTQNDVEIILKDGSTAMASDHMDKLITSEVANTITEIDDEFDLKSQSDVMTLSEMIADHLTRNTGIDVETKLVFSEFKKQLKFN